jgi:hypothetical protein
MSDYYLHIALDISGDNRASGVPYTHMYVSIYGDLPERPDRLTLDVGWCAINAHLSRKRILASRLKCRAL